MKKLICAFLAALILSTPAYAVETITDDAIEIKAPSAILMEKTSGEVIYEKMPTKSGLRQASRRS